MTDTITIPPAVEDGPVEELLFLDPAVITIGANVRTDLPDAKEFARSIKERGVIEPVTVYRDEEGGYVCLRGQRRTVTASQVGTPTRLIPVRVVAKPADADRITDQMVENIHRAAMAEKEVLDGVEQLALLGVSAAQIAKRTSLARPTVNAALAVAAKESSRARVEAGDLTLTQAAIFAEFEDDLAATERLERRIKWGGGGLEHEAQRLRDEAAERAEHDAEVTRLRDEGLPVLTGENARAAQYAVRVAQLRTAKGEPIPEAEWGNVPGAAVLVTEEWQYPQVDTDPDNPDTDDGEASGVDGEDDEDRDDVDPVKVYVPVWVLPDTGPATEAGYVVPSRPPYSGTGHSEPESDEEAEARREAAREERRRVIANNKAWASAESVRRRFITSLLGRNAPPKGAEALICEAVVTGQHGLYKAMEGNHPMLRKLLGVGEDKARWNSHADLHTIASRATTPKAATMTTLAAVLAAWEDSIGKHTWRNPNDWDDRVLSALIEWGYEPNEVESLLLDEPADDGDSPTATDSSGEPPENGEGDQGQGDETGESGA